MPATKKRPSPFGPPTSAPVPGRRPVSPFPPPPKKAKPTKKKP
jgi:hypothetical protein